MVWKQKIWWSGLVFLPIFSPALAILTANADPGLTFIENKNQWPYEINFSAKIPGGNMFLQPGQFSYYLVDLKKLEEIHERTHDIRNEADASYPGNENINRHLLQANFIGANDQSVPSPFGLKPTYYNYFLDSDQEHWASKARAYSGVLYADFYKGIDLKVYSVDQNLKYDYIVTPLGDPSKIAVAYAGADKIFLDNGNLQIKTSLGDLIERKPYAFQFINGKKIQVKCAYALNGNIVTFRFPDGYDKCFTLTIDPLLIFSTYSGSTADNWGSTATPGEHGNLYSAGVTNQITLGGKFPSTAGAFQTTYGGAYDIAILKYDSAGGNLLYASYLGGSESESPHSLVMNANEELIILGTTSSKNFPTTSGAFDQSFNGGSSVEHVVEYLNGSDLFVAKISKDGNALLSSTYIGGKGNDGLNPADGGLVKNYGDELRGDIITDELGNIYISSVTSSNDFPVTLGVNTVYNGGKTDALLLKFNSSLSTMIWGTFIGGNGSDASHTLKLDHDKNIFLAGGTNSLNFPVTVGSYQHALAGDVDGWIAKIQSDGTAIMNATFTGTPEFDQVYFLDLNANEDVYVYGQTTGNFPISPHVYSNPGSGQFLQKLNNTLSTSVFSTVFGSKRGIPDISPTAFLVNNCNNIYMTGWGGLINSKLGFWQSNTNGMPVSSDAYQKSTSGSDFYFIVLTADASQFLYGTYMGGSQSRTHVDGGTSRFDKGGIVYHAVCSGCQALNASGTPTSDFPTTKGAWSRTNRSRNCNNAAFKFDLSSLKARLQTNSVKLDMPGINKVCMPDKIVFQNKCIGGQIYEWDLGDGTQLTKTDTSSIVHQYLNIGKYTVKLRVLDKGTCIGKDSTTTIVNVYNTSTKVQDDDALCDGAFYQLKTTGQATFNWTSSDGTFQSVDSENIHTVTPKDTTIYYVIITEASGCIKKDTVQLNVIPKADTDFELIRNSDCFSRPEIHVKNLTKLMPTDNVFFDFGDGETSDADEVEHKYASDNTYNIKLVVSREFCTFEKVASVLAYTLKVPNVITPGEKDKNDTFTIQYGDVPGSTPADYGIKVSILVYNRWGRLVYESTDYQYDWAAEGLAAGVYYYEVTVAGHATCKSWLHVIK